MALKEAPQRWQLNTYVCWCGVLLSVPYESTPGCLDKASVCLSPHRKQFDVVVAFEERVFDQILEGACARGRVCV